MLPQIEGTGLDWPLTVKTSVKHCPAVDRAAASGLAIENAMKSSLIKYKYEIISIHRSLADINNNANR